MPSTSPAWLGCWVVGWGGSNRPGSATPRRQLPTYLLGIVPMLRSPTSISFRMMLRLSGFRRAVAALCGSWFVLFSLLPGSVRPCPMHAAGHPATTAASPAGHAHHEPAPPRSESQSTCDCSTSCCAAPAILASPPDVAVFFIASPHGEPTATAPRLPHARARLLPYGNGPPALTRG